MSKKPYIPIAIGICAVIVGIARMWARTLTLTRTTVAVQAAEEDEIPEEYGFVDGITENNGADDYYVSLCNETLQELPEWLLGQFEDSGWTIMVTSEDINDVYLDGRYSAGEGNVNGATVYGLERIVITDSIQAASTAPVHEMGHWLDYITAPDGLSFSSDSEEFISLYDEEAEDFIATFGIANPDSDNRQELCADLFRYYWTEPGKLERKCPGLYAWMDELVGELQMMGF